MCFNILTSGLLVKGIRLLVWDMNDLVHTQVAIHHSLLPFSYVLLCFTRIIVVNNSVKKGKKNISECDDHKINRSSRKQAPSCRR